MNELETAIQCYRQGIPSYSYARARLERALRVEGWNEAEIVKFIVELDPPEIDDEFS